jgi:secondary thiamine-phosphate synthase enzyme
MWKRLDVKTSAPEELVDITAQVERAVLATGIQEGACLVYSPHTTGGITINENADPDVKSDMIHAITSLVPLRDPAYRHAEGNSAAHVKASMMGFSTYLPVESGRLSLGRWQGVYFCEFDGPRQRQVLVSVVSLGDELE